MRAAPHLLVEDGLGLAAEARLLPVVAPLTWPGCVETGPLQPRCGRHRQRRPGGGGGGAAAAAGSAARSVAWLSPFPRSYHGSDQGRREPQPPPGGCATTDWSLGRPEHACRQGKGSCVERRAGDAPCATSEALPALYCVILKTSCFLHLGDLQNVRSVFGALTCGRSRAPAGLRRSAGAVVVQVASVAARQANQAGSGAAAVWKWLRQGLRRAVGQGDTMTRASTGSPPPRAGRRGGSSFQGSSRSTTVESYFLFASASAPCKQALSKH